VNGSHTTWVTPTAVEYPARARHFVDEVLRFCSETDDWPGEQILLLVEQGWSILHYIEHRPPRW